MKVKLPRFLGILLGIVLIAGTLMMISWKPISYSTDPDWASIEEVTKIDEIGQLFPKLQSIEQCSYKAIPINPSPIGPATVRIAGYLYFTSSGIKIFQTQYEWSQIEIEPHYQNGGNEPIPLLAFESVEFNKDFAPIESRISFYLLPDEDAIYFQGVF